MVILIAEGFAVIAHQNYKQNLKKGLYSVIYVDHVEVLVMVETYKDTSTSLELFI